MALEVKDDALRGDRVQMFAELAGYSKYEALGRLTYLWNHCVSNGTDLLDDRRVLAFLGVPSAVLVDADLGERVGDGVRVRGVRDEVDARMRRSEQARRAGLASAQLRAISQSPRLPVNSEPTASQLRVDSELPSRAISDLQISDLQISGSGSLFPPEPSSEIPRDLKQQGPGRKRKMPEGFAPDDAHRTFARENRLDLNAEFAQFVDHHAARASTFADWPAALRTWLRNAVKYRRGGGGAAPAAAPERRSKALL